MKLIEIKILEYIKNRGDHNPAVFPFLELYLMSKYKESDYIGAYLIKKVKEMENTGLVTISNLEIYITPKGKIYLNSHKE